jgi:hypothetical protein
MAVRYAITFHGTAYLDDTPICSIHNGKSRAVRLFCSTDGFASSQVDKLFNPFTLLAGPVLVAHVVYKSTIPTENGGFHLPWWCVSALLSVEWSCS